jgi:hypothetical protein
VAFHLSDERSSGEDKGGGLSNHEGEEEEKTQMHLSFKSRWGIMREPGQGHDARSQSSDTCLINLAAHHADSSSCAVKFEVPELALGVQLCTRRDTSGRRKRVRGSWKGELNRSVRQRTN